MPCCGLVAVEFTALLFADNMAPFTCVDIAKIGLRAHGHTLPYGLNRKTYSVTEQEESDLDDELWIEVPCIAAVTSTGISLSTLRPVLHESVVGAEHPCFSFLFCINEFYCLINEFGRRYTLNFCI